MHGRKLTLNEVDKENINYRFNLTVYGYMERYLSITIFLIQKL